MLSANIEKIREKITLFVGKDRTTIKGHLAMVKINYEIFEESPTIRHHIKFDLMHLKEAKRILDLGCGNGDDILRHDFQSEVIGVDVSKSLCLQAKMKTKREILCSDGKMLPLVSDSFEGVLCNQVIEHIDNDRGLLSEIRRILKDEGKLVISTSKYSGLRWFIITRYGITRAFRGRYLDPTHIREYTFKDFFRLLNESKFDVIDFQGTGISFIAGYVDSALWALACELKLKKQAERFLNFICSFSGITLPFWQLFTIACTNHKET